MPASIGSLDATNMLLNQDQQDTSFAGQHSRSSSMQSTSTDYGSTAADREARFPEIVKRDMEFFMARLSRTNTNDSTVSTASSVSR
jgi:hypothetical protein